MIVRDGHLLMPTENGIKEVAIQNAHVNEITRKIIVDQYELRDISVDEKKEKRVFWKKKRRVL